MFAHRQLSFFFQPTRVVQRTADRPFTLVFVHVVDRRRDVLVVVVVVRVNLSVVNPASVPPQRRLAPELTAPGERPRVEHGRRGEDRLPDTLLPG